MAVQLCARPRSDARCGHLSPSATLFCRRCVWYQTLQGGSTLSAHRPGRYAYRRSPSSRSVLSLHCSAHTPPTPTPTPCHAGAGILGFAHHVLRRINMPRTSLLSRQNTHSPSGRASARGRCTEASTPSARWHTSSVVCVSVPASPVRSTV